MNRKEAVNECKCHLYNMVSVNGKSYGLSNGYIPNNSQTAKTLLLHPRNSQLGSDDGRLLILQRKGELV